MPTGYTADIEKGITFRQFALSCAHAFGACIILRDEPSNSEIQEFQPSLYYKESIEKAQFRMAELKAMTPEQWDIEAKAEFDSAVEYYEKSHRDKTELENKYKTMLKSVVEWNPPTSEHNGLKEFMAEQIRTSVRFDCNHSYPQMPTLRSGREWYNEQINKALRDIGYYTDEHNKEIARTESRNAWVKNLKDSLPEE